MRTRKANGFTLVELLVVITIITILAALLLPVLEKARKAAYTVGCQNHQRQIITCLHGYADDDSGEYLPGHHEVWADGGTVYWSYHLMGYADMEPKRRNDGRDFRNTIFHCLSPTRVDPDGYFYSDFRMKTSYMANGATLGGCYYVPARKRRSVFPRASHTFVFIDGTLNSATCGTNTHTFEHVARMRERANLTAHEDGFNASFLDGHVRRFPKDGNPYKDS